MFIYVKFLYIKTDFYFNQRHIGLPYRRTLAAEYLGNLIFVEYLKGLHRSENVEVEIQEKLQF